MEKIGVGMVTTHTPDPAGDANIDQTYSAIRKKMMIDSYGANAFSIYESDVLFLKDYDVMLHKTDHATFMTRRGEALVRLSHLYLGSLEANDTYWLCQWELSVFMSVRQPGMDVEFMGSVVGTSDAQLERLHIKQGLNPLMVIISSDGSHCAPPPPPHEMLLSHILLIWSRVRIQESQGRTMQQDDIDALGCMDKMRDYWRSQGCDGSMANSGVLPTEMALTESMNVQFQEEFQFDLQNMTDYTREQIAKQAFCDAQHFTRYGFVMPHHPIIGAPQYMG
jgi:hypothetical protein